jgi:hypothetical protein
MNDQRLILDAWIDLTGICDDAGWHSASAIAALTELGIAARDAECFIDFAFAQHAAVTDGAELTREQAARLTRE